jgi:hypothetical protein
VTPEELAEQHPRLYHVTDPGNWEGIQKHGLLSTSSLLSLFEIPAARRVVIERQRRPGLTGKISTSPDGQGDSAP